MWVETPVFYEDLKQLCATESIPWDQLRGKTIFVTGATGLIGQTLVSGLLYAGMQRGLGLTVTALVRNREKAEKIFEAQLVQKLPLRFAVGTVEALPDMDFPIDYIVHGASPTASAWFVEHPVETIETAVTGTQNVLKLAKEKNVSGFVYLSSMEVYGTVSEEKLLTENDLGYLNPLLVRSCYPESKRLCEALCACYAAEYQTPTTIARLAQTFGPGVDVNDRRVFAELARCAVQRTDMILQTKGTSKRCYVYTMDAVSAILSILLKGHLGEAYNVANPETYCSIYEMAEKVMDTFTNGESAVRVMNNETVSGKYPPEHHLYLDTTAISNLEWKPTIDLVGMYDRMMSCF